ncbi:MAG: cytochrome c biogenesis protein CcsA [Planctomycetota bacterium]|nr:cytochrome c biogenesis protein CcsA [Planctomycetota bacterium]
MNNSNWDSARALRRACSFLGLALAAIFALGGTTSAQGGHNHAPGEFVDHVHGSPRTAPYDAELVHAFRTLPVQDGGRIKPFESLVQVTLLKLNEKRSVSIPDEPMYGALAGVRLSAMEWALDVLLYPDQASDYPVFVVTDSEALRIIGLSEVAKRKRDRYSWNELAPGIDRLRPYYDEYRRIEEKDRSRLQTQIVQLGNDLAEYQGLQRVCDVARARFGTGGSSLLREAFGEVDGVRFSVAAAQAGRLIAAFRALDASGAANGDAAQAAEYTALADFLGRQLRMAQGSSAVSWLPPSDVETETWLDFSGVFDEIRADGVEAHSAQIEAIAKLERMIDATGDQGALSAAGQDFVAHVRQMADRRGEGSMIDLEVSYHEADYFYRALQIFVLGFLLCAFGWLRPQLKLLYLGGWATSVLGAGLVVAGLTVRCILLSRPPVSTLYETIVFITGIAVLVALVAEAINKRRIALSLGAFVGALGMFVAGAFELLEQRDTLVELQAVLRTNFWLATHVTSVTIGYAGGLLAGFIAHIYLLGKLVGWKKDSYSFYRNIGRMTYGVLCFAVVFATVGTILGGIWANDSWGRFWGWDPKENGALMIVLWQLLILHGRLGGFWRDYGIAMLAVLGNIVIAFSWFGVNLMGVGLHSYGFQAGTKFWLTVFYATQLLVVAAGAIAWYRDRAATAAAQKASA